MKQGIETGPINKETVVQVIGSVPSRTLARPEVHVSLLIQDWRVRGLGVYRDSIIETTDVDTELNPVAWNPRKDVVEYLVDLEKDVLSSQGATSMTDFLLTNYVGNMKKLAAISGTFSGMLKQNLQEELPRSLGAFMKGYLDQRGQTQTDCAMETGVSQALISNAVKGRPISIGLIKILKGLDVEDEIKEVAFGLYAQPTVKDEVDVTGILHRSRWVQDLYSLDKETLERSGFEGSEDYLLTRFINTATRLTQITETVDRLPDQITPKDIKSNQPTIFGFPSINVVNQKTMVAPILLRVWQSKGLFLPREGRMQYEG